MTARGSGIIYYWGFSLSVIVYFPRLPLHLIFTRASQGVASRRIVGANVVSERLPGVSI